MCDGYLYTTTMLASVHFVVIVMIVDLDARCFVHVGTNSLIQWHPEMDNLHHIVLIVPSLP